MIEIKVGVGETLQDVIKGVYFSPKEMSEENCKYLAYFCMEHGVKMWIDPQEVLDLFGRLKNER